MRRTTKILAMATLLLVLTATAAIGAEGPGGLLDGFLSWAWARHHYMLSWYIRPLFVLPFAYFSYRRSLSGIVLTFVALSTSMFWFPAPEQVDPRVEEFLAFEREWIAGEWTLAKILITSIVPLSLTALCLAFWKRSLVWGLVIINAIAQGKVCWGVAFAEGSGWAMLLPALAGALVCDAIVLYVARRMRTKPSPQPRQPTSVSSTRTARGDRAARAKRSRR